MLSIGCGLSTRISPNVSRETFLSDLDPKPYKGEDSGVWSHGTIEDMECLLRQFAKP